MQHINIQPLIDAVKVIEKEEAIRILKENGGHIRVKKNTCPYAEFYGGNGPSSALIKEIGLSKDEKDVIITVWDDIDGGTFELKPEDLYPGSLMGAFQML